MISKISIRNFQSLKKVDLELGPFTVIVGNSATGKSALIRALKAVSSNVRGTSLVTSGESNLSVSVESESWKITLEKGTTSNSYRVCDLTTGSEKEYTKLAGEVPADVTALLGMEPMSEGRSVNFAGERDQPFLLDESGQQVAKVLGDLTNVSTILEAIREANRRRTAQNASVKVWKADLATLQGRLPKFASLASKRAVLTSLDNAVADAEELSCRISELSELVANLVKYQAISQRSFPEIPIYEHIDSLFTDMKQLVQIAKSIVTANSRSKELQSDIATNEANIKNLENQYQTLLIEIGECPTCHQSISSDHEIHLSGQH